MGRVDTVYARVDRSDQSTGTGRKLCSRQGGPRCCAGLERICGATEPTNRVCRTQGRQNRTMQTERNHPDLTELVELIGRGCLSHAVHEHLLACVVCTRALDELVQIAVA